MDENIEDIGYNERLVMNKGDVTFLDNNGQPISNPKEYFEKRRLANTTYTEKLQVGDIVKLKDFVGSIVVVKYVDFKVNDVINFDYAGPLYNSDNKDLIMFGQEDIEVVYSDKLPNKTL